MNSDRILRATFIVSVISHGLILLQSPDLNPFSPAPKKQIIAVRYIKQNSLSAILPKTSLNSVSGGQRTFSKSEQFLNLDSKIITANRRVPAPYIEQESNTSKGSSAVNSSKGSRALQNRPAGFSKPVFVAPSSIAIKKKITLPAIEIAKIDNPSYITYYQIVREKIRRSAYQNYTHNETGEVYISFIISNDGYIKGARIAEEKTTANGYLKEIAIRSVRDASPFPNFPKELDYPQLSFNIIISFEIE